jgi:hypothetical protein
MEIFIFWLGFSIAVGILASKRGRSGIGWFLFSFILSPLLGLIFVLVLKANPEISEEGSSKDSMRLCPECKEPIRVDARKCKHCGSDVNQLVTSFKSYSNKAKEIAEKIEKNKFDISDCIKLMNEIGYKCNQIGVINTSFEVVVENKKHLFANKDDFKNWIVDGVIKNVLTNQQVNTDF